MTEKKAECPAVNKEYSVGEVSSLMNITRKTLFYYDRIGLLLPAERKGVQKVKYYDAYQLERLRQILAYRSAGLSITDIKELLDDKNANHLEIMENAMKRLLEEKDRKTQEISRLQTMIKTEQKKSAK